MFERISLFLFPIPIMIGCYDLEPGEFSVEETDTSAETFDEADIVDEAEGCQMTTSTFRLSGSIEYREFKEGNIDLSISESMSIECGESSESVRLVHPGYRVGAMTLPAPGAFDTMVTVSHIKGHMPPTLSIRAVNEASLDAPQCQAGQVMQITADDNSDIDIQLDSGYCPILN